MVTIQQLLAPNYKDVTTVGKELALEDPTAAEEVMAFIIIY